MLFFFICICVSQIIGTCSEVHCTQYGRHTGSLGDESPINTLCESVRSAFSYTVSGTTSSLVILFVLPFNRTLYSHTALLYFFLFLLLMALVKQDLPYSLTPVTSVLPAYCVAPSVAGALYNPTDLQGSEACNPGSEKKKCVGEKKKMRSSVSRIPLIFGWILQSL